MGFHTAFYKSANAKLGAFYLTYFGRYVGPMYWVQCKSSSQYPQVEHSQWLETAVKANWTGDRFSGFATAALHEIGRFRPIEIPKISSHVHKTTKFARLPIETEFLPSQQ